MGVQMVCRVARDQTLVIAVKPKGELLLPKVQRAIRSSHCQRVFWRVPNLLCPSQRVRGSLPQVLLILGERLAKGFVWFVVLHPKAVSQCVKETLICSVFVSVARTEMCTHCVRC